MAIVSVTKLFLAGIGPGILLTSLIGYAIIAAQALSSEASGIQKRLVARLNQDFIFNASSNPWWNLLWIFYCDRKCGNSCCLCFYC